MEEQQMKFALIFEKDVASSQKTSQLLKWFGYMTAPVHSAAEAFNVVKAINTDVIVTCAASNAGERRLITNELKRLAPNATIILMTENDSEYESARMHGYAGVDALIKRPASVDAFRRILHSELDTVAIQSRGITREQERRKR